MAYKSWPMGGVTINGLVIVDKPEGFTSFDVVAVLRRLAGQKRAGHTGTLDPMATGVLPVLLGPATRLADRLPDTDKRYRAGFRLGVETDTLDVTGHVVAEHPVDVDASQVESALAAFRGEIWQTPPMYSAVQVGGRRLYDLARKGVTVDRPARRVVIRTLALTGADDVRHEYEIDITCSKGTYIRSLVDDLGRSLRCGAVLTALRRTEACGFSEHDAITIDALRQDGAAAYLLPPDAALGAYPAVTVSAEQAARLLHGDTRVQPRLPDKIGGFAFLRVYVPEEEKDALFSLSGIPIATPPPSARPAGDSPGLFLGLGALAPETGVFKLDCQVIER